MKRHVVRGLVAVAVFAAIGSLYGPVRASIFGEENITLAQQLAELIKIHDQLVKVSQAVERGADVAEDIYENYELARGGVDELKSYTTDKFLRDFRKDVYKTYPGFEILLEGSDSRRLRHWKNSHSRSPFTSYEMITAVFGDLTDPLIEREKRGELRMDRARIMRYEAAGALALSNEAEAWTKSADEDAMELYRLAQDADADQAQHLSARALALIAVQNSHTIRLLSRSVRFDGIRGAMEWSKRVDAVKQREQLRGETGEALRRVSRPPRMMTFPEPW